MGRSRELAREHAPRDPDHAAVFADRDPEFDGLALGIPARVLGEGEERDAQTRWGPFLFHCCSL
jgi:hypothetical protein